MMNWLGRLLTTIAIVLAPLQASQAQEVQCSKAGFELRYQARDEAGIYYMWEAEPALPSSAIRIEKYDTEYELQWSTEARRACTMGISRCYLELDFNLNGFPAGTFEAEMNYFTIDRVDFLLMSHLREQIAQSYMKDHPFDDFALDASPETTRKIKDDRDFEIPNLFVSACN